MLYKWIDVWIKTKLSVCAGVRACIHACVRACVRVCVCVDSAQDTPTHLETHILFRSSWCFSLMLFGAFLFRCCSNTQQQWQQGIIINHYVQPFIKQAISIPLSFFSFLLDLRFSVGEGGCGPRMRLNRDRVRLLLCDIVLFVFLGLGDSLVAVVGSDILIGSEFPAISAHRQSLTSCDLTNRGWQSSLTSWYTWS